MSSLLIFEVLYIGKQTMIHVLNVAQWRDKSNAVLLSLVDLFTAAGAGMKGADVVLALVLALAVTWGIRLCLSSIFWQVAMRVFIGMISVSREAWSSRLNPWWNKCFCIEASNPVSPIWAWNSNRYSVLWKRFIDLPGAIDNGLSSVDLIRVPKAYSQSLIELFWYWDVSWVIWGRICFSALPERREKA